MSEVLSQVIDQILKAPESELTGQKQQVDQLVDYLCEITDLDMTPSICIDDGATITSQGKAVSMLVAARCASEYMRTQVFLRGVYQAIQDQLSKIDSIDILYAGTGPFGLLLIPLLPLFRPDQVRVTLLDIHAESLSALDSLIDELGVRDRLVEISCIDILQWAPAEGQRFNLIISETMKAMLVQEPQVSIFAHLSPYLAEQGRLVPEQVIIRGWLLSGAAAEPESIGEVFALNYQSACELRQCDEPVIERVLTIPDYSAEMVDLKFTTSIQTYGDHWLEEGQCSLNIAQYIYKANPEPGAALNCIYRFGEVPGFEFDYPKKADLTDLPLPEFTDTSILDLPCLSRIWHKAQRDRVGKLSAELRAEEWEIDRGVYEALGLSSAEGTQLFFQNESIPSLIDELLAKNKGSLSIEQKNAVELSLSRYQTL